MAVAAVSTTNGATGLCYDTPLTVTFSSTPSLGSAGLINIYNVTNSTTPVDTISAANGLVQQRTFPGDGQSFSYNTIVINGSTVTIYPHFSVLTSNQTYYVTIDNGTFTDVKVGGRHVITGTVEIVRDLPRNLGVSVFSDVGNAFDVFGHSPNPAYPHFMEYSVGVGVRWRLPVVTFGIDVAEPISRPGAGPRFDINFSPKL